MLKSYLEQMCQGMLNFMILTDIHYSEKIYMHQCMEVILIILPNCPLMLNGITTLCAHIPLKFLITKYSPSAKIESYFKVVFYANDNGNVINLNCFHVKQYPIPDDTVSEVTLFDIDSIKNNHLLFLNSHLLEIIPDEVMNYHKVSMKQHKTSRST